MDKLWIVFLFLGVFLLINNFAKRFLIKRIASQKTESTVFINPEEEDDPKVSWEKRGQRREPLQAEFDLPEEDFFENEKNEFCKNFEEEFKNLSEEEISEVLEKSGMLNEGGNF